VEVFLKIEVLMTNPMYLLRNFTFP